MSKLDEKLKRLPSRPGVYFHKSADGEIIYVGKAAVLKNRVRQYFQNSRGMDLKTRALVKEIADVDWIETESEIDALFLESEMVKRYMPRYNVLLRDDKSLVFIRIDMKSEWPFVSFTRNPAGDDAEYFGPFYNALSVRKALRYLRRAFPYYTRPLKAGQRPDLDAHLGLAPVGLTSREYKASLRQLISYIKGNRRQLIKTIERDMLSAAEHQEYERAALLRNRLRYLGELQQRIMFGDREFLDISSDHALRDLMDLLGLKEIPARIEGYDISHMSGTNVVASMVVFTNGASDRAEYRKFKALKQTNDDFANMHDTILRRFGERNIKAWGSPDLILIDGGKGQLGAAIAARDEKGYERIPMIGLAKKQERIVIHQEGSGITINRAKLNELGGGLTPEGDFVMIDLPLASHVIKLLQRIRDESHRFAVSYHSTLKRKNQIASSLDDIPGIGPATRRKLIKRFGSLKAAASASEKDIVAVVGPSKARLLKTRLSGQQRA